MATTRINADNLWWFVFAYLMEAERFLLAAKREFEGIEVKFSQPGFFCASHAIELAVKAFLLAAGTSESELKKADRRHDLSKLLDLANEKGLLQQVTLRADEHETLVAFSELHRTHYFRYPSQDGASFYSWDRYELLVEHLIHQVTTYVRALHRLTQITPATP